MIATLLTLQNPSALAAAENVAEKAILLIAVPYAVGLLILFAARAEAKR